MEVESVHRSCIEGSALGFEEVTKWLEVTWALGTCIYFTMPLGDEQLKDLASRDAVLMAV